VRRLPTTGSSSGTEIDHIVGPHAGAGMDDANIRLTPKPNGPNRTAAAPPEARLSNWVTTRNSASRPLNTRRKMGRHARPLCYAVVVGFDVGVFLDWPSTERSVSGFPGAIYNGCYSEAEARDFIEQFRARAKTQEPDSWCTADAAPPPPVVGENVTPIPSQKKASHTLSDMIICITFCFQNFEVIHQ